MQSLLLSNAFEPVRPVPRACGSPAVTSDHARPAVDAEQQRTADGVDMVELQRQAVEEDVQLRLALRKDDAAVLERECGPGRSHLEEPDRSKPGQRALLHWRLCQNPRLDGLWS